jgi:outer membrane protein OmpA-like peptidoglycan-associated protein
LSLLQARKAFELAGRYGAQEYTRQIYAEAKEALDQANDFQNKGSNNKKLLEFAGQSVELSNEAINITRQRVAREELEALMDARRAEMAAMEASIASLATQRQELEATIAAMDRRTAAAEREAADLNAMLSYALSQVADSRATAAGYVVSLPDILFDVDKAKLKPEAQKPLAKLSGILLVMRGLGVSISGYTDSTGSPEHNMGLSQQRAEAVMNFIAAEGVSGERITAVGRGIENPIATNDTPEGRRKNRRVEILLTEAK